MARRATDLIAATELGRCLANLAEGSKPNYTKMSKDFWKLYDVDVSDEQLRKMHAGTVDPTNVAIEVLAALIRFYGCSPRDLGPVAEARLNWVRTLDTSEWRWMRVLPGQARLFRPEARPRVTAKVA